MMATSLGFTFRASCHATYSPYYLASDTFHWNYHCKHTGWVTTYSDSDTTGWRKLRRYNFFILTSSQKMQKCGQENPYMICVSCKKKRCWRDNTIITLNNEYGRHDAMMRVNSFRECPVVPIETLQCEIKTTQMQCNSSWVTINSNKDHVHTKRCMVDMEVFAFCFSYN